MRAFARSLMPKNKRWAGEMLTVNTDGGITIVLNGRAGDPLFWWSASLLVLGLIVAWICFTMPVEYAIGALFVFAVAMFGFNIKRHQAKKRHVFGKGKLMLTPKRFVIDDKALSLSDIAVVDIQGERLIVRDRGIEYCFMGFDDANEMNIAKQVLEGKSIQSRAANIRMLSNH